MLSLHTVGDFQGVLQRERERHQGIEGICKGVIIKMTEYMLVRRKGRHMTAGSEVISSSGKPPLSLISLYFPFLP